MAIATYSDLKTSVATWLNRSNLTARIPEFITLAESRIAYGSKAPPMPSEPLRIRAMEASEYATISDQRIALPTGFLSQRRFYLSGTPVTELKFIAPDLFWQLYMGSASGKPQAFTVEGNELVFGPAPDGSYTGQLLFHKKFTAFSDDADTNWLLTNSPGTYLHGALAEAHLFARNSAQAAAELSMFAGAINSLNQADKSDRYAGPWQSHGDTGNP